MHSALETLPAGARRARTPTSPAVRVWETHGSISASSSEQALQGTVLAKGPITHRMGVGIGARKQEQDKSSRNLAHASAHFIDTAAI